MQHARRTSGHPRAQAKKRWILMDIDTNGPAVPGPDVPARDDGSDHHLFRKALWPYLRGIHPLVILTSPVIYACSIPFLLLDFAVTIYQAVCFPVYGIPKVSRHDYLVFDRGSLRYLNHIEKIGCIYCSYANGLLAYVVEI